MLRLCRHTAESFQPTLPSQRVRRSDGRRKSRNASLLDMGALSSAPRSVSTSAKRRHPHLDAFNLEPLPMPSEFIVYSTDKPPPMQVL